MEGDRSDLWLVTIVVPTGQADWEFTCGPMDRMWADFLMDWLAHEGTVRVSRARQTRP